MKTINFSGMEALFILLSFERLEKDLTRNPRSQKLYASITNKLRKYVYSAGT